MLANADLHKELNVVDEFISNEKEAAIRHVLKLLTLAVKLLHDIRSNQVLDLKARNVKLIEPKNKPEITKK